MPIDDRIQKISVIVPESPFVSGSLQGIRHCLAALDVQKLMEWWPGKPHTLSAVSAHWTERAD
jgi:hypothetical protein